MGLTLIMDRKFVNRTNKHVDQRGEGHSEPLVAEHYYGPNVRQSAWSLWEIYSAGGSQSHLRYYFLPLCCHNYDLLHWKCKVVIR